SSYHLPSSSLPRPPPPPLLPYTTLFRSEVVHHPRNFNITGAVVSRHDGVGHRIARRDTAHAIENRSLEVGPGGVQRERGQGRILDRKSTRLNSSHVSSSYAVFCLKKKNN